MLYLKYVFPPASLSGLSCCTNRDLAVPHSIQPLNSMDHLNYSFLPCIPSYLLRYVHLTHVATWLLYLPQCALFVLYEDHQSLISSCFRRVVFDIHVCEVWQTWNTFINTWRNKRCTDWRGKGKRHICGQQIYILSVHHRPPQNIGLRVWKR
jgi:hypothetical protein